MNSPAKSGTDKVGMWRKEYPKHLDPIEEQEEHELEENGGASSGTNVSSGSGADEETQQPTIMMDL